MKLNSFRAEVATKFILVCKLVCTLVMAAWSAVLRRIQQSQL